MRSANVSSSTPTSTSGSAASWDQGGCLKDVERDWNINDLRDVLALSTAIPYCDVVVTDRKAWDVTKNRAHLDEEFDAQIFCSLDDLVDHLGL